MLLPLNTARKGSLVTSLKEITLIKALQTYNFRIKSEMCKIPQNLHKTDVDVDVEGIWSEIIVK